MRARQRKKNLKRVLYGRAGDELLVPWPIIVPLNQIRSSGRNPPNDPDSFWVRRLDERLREQVEAQPETEER